MLTRQYTLERLKSLSWCENLTNLDLSSFDTSKVTDMGFMFWSCNKLSLDCSHWNVDKAT